MKMKNNKYKILSMIALIVILANVFSLVTSSKVAEANPTYFPPHTACAIGSATTSVFSISTSTPTSTLTCDAFNLATLLNTPTAVDGMSLAIQFRAPQATTALIGTVQYSDDNIDWYGNNLIDLATTTATSTIGPSRTFSLTPGTTATTSKILDVAMPTRYVRVQFSATAGSATSSLWAVFIPRKEVK